MKREGGARARREDPGEGGCACIICITELNIVEDPREVCTRVKLSSPTLRRHIEHNNVSYPDGNDGHVPTAHGSKDPRGEVIDGMKQVARCGIGSSN